MKEPFLSAVPVLEKLEKAGFEAYFVGGSVRDYLLNKEISDVDIATSATPWEVKALFPKTVDIGIEHGTVLVLFHHQSYEITTFRTEGEYQDYRRPKDVAFIRNLLEDLQRRDFTMNAIAMDKNGKLIDPFNGRTAIKEKLIQTVGMPEDRFHEDALLMMRAVRFISQLSFQIEVDTLKALTEFNHLLEKIAVERKRAEFEKLLTGENRKSAFKLILDTNLNDYLPGLQNQKDVLGKLQELDCAGLNLAEMWALILYLLNLEQGSAAKFLRNWRLPVKVIKEIEHLSFTLNKRRKNEWSINDLYLAGGQAVVSAERLNQVINGENDPGTIDYWQAKYNQLPIKNRSELMVTGTDLMAWFNQQGGPWINQTLFQVENAILAGTIVNDKQSIKEWLIKCNQK